MIERRIPTSKARLKKRAVNLGSRDRYVAYRLGRFVVAAVLLTVVGLGCQLFVNGLYVNRFETTRCGPTYR